MSSSQCFYSMCDKCDSKECACDCHRKRSDFYESLDKTSKKSSTTPIVTNPHDRHRGRPAKSK